MKSGKKKFEKKGKADLNILFIYNMPFRAISKLTGGIVDGAMADGIVEMVNGHFFRGIGQVIGGYFKNQSANRRYEKIFSEDVGRE